MANAGSALLWNTGAYRFGNADSKSAANANGQSDGLLAGFDGKKQNPNVLVNEENSLLNPKKKIQVDIPLSVAPLLDITRCCIGRQRRPPFDETFLLKENGLDFIDKHFKSLKFKGKDNERRDLRKLLDQYKEWCFVE